MQGSIYARYSLGRDRDQTSTIEVQDTKYREKAQRDGVAIDPDHIYVDRDLSGASVVDMQMADRWKSLAMPAHDGKAK